MLKIWRWFFPKFEYWSVECTVENGEIIIPAQWGEVVSVEMDIITGQSTAKFRRVVD